MWLSSRKLSVALSGCARLLPMLGVFDSGVGGLNVLAAIRKRLPRHSILYLGDSARTPYGNRSRKAITWYTAECCFHLFERGCSLIVLACNTASAETLRVLQKEWLPGLREHFHRPLNIIGVIRPLAEEAVQISKSGRIAVVGTRSTIESKTYDAELTALRNDVRVISKACPLLVPLVEEGWIDKPETRRILRTYLLPIKAENPDVLILGCTHYEAMHHLFSAKMGNRCTVLSTPSIVSEKLEAYLDRHPEYAMLHDGKMTFLTTGDPVRFAEIGSCFYGDRMENVTQVVVSPQFDLALQSAS